MAKNKPKLRKSEVAKHGNTHLYKLISDKKSSSSKRIDILTAVLLGMRNPM